MNRALVRRATAGRGGLAAAAGPRRTGGGGPRRPPRQRRVRRRHRRACSPAPGSRCACCPRPLPTPVTAFATLHLGAVAGIMITASHNPPQDNGYKLYLGDGAQIVAAGRRGDLRLHRRGRRRWPTSRCRDDGVEVLGEDVLDAYVDGRGRARRRRARAISSPCTRRCTASAPRRCAAASPAAGFAAAPRGRGAGRARPRLPDGGLPEPGGARRPRPVAGPRAVEVGADLVLANDPDADRLGGRRARSVGRRRLARPHRRRARHAPRRPPRSARARHDPDDVLATTVVSSRLLSKLAAAAGRRLRRGAHRLQVGGAHPAPGSAVPVRLRGGARLLRGRRWCATRTASPPRWWPPSWPLGSRPRGRRSSTGCDEVFRTHGAHVTRQQSIRLDGQRLAGPRHGRHGLGARRRRPPRWPGARSSRWRTSRRGTPPAAERRADLDARRRPAGRPPERHRAQAQVLRRGRGARGRRRPGRPQRRPRAIVDEVLAAAAALLADPRPLACAARTIPPGGQAVPKRRSPASPRPGTM